MTFNRNHRKTNINQVNSFLSPCQKYNHRSFSASSLKAQLQLSKSNLRNQAYWKQPKMSFGQRDRGRDNPRIEIFKKNILGDGHSKLNKINLDKGHIKNQFQRVTYLQEVDRNCRAEFRDNQRVINSLKDENERLLKQKKDDLILISRQKQIINNLEITVQSLQYWKSQVQPKRQCQCCNQNKQSQQNDFKFKWEEQKKQFKKQIRQLVIQYENMKENVSYFENLYKKQKEYCTQLKQIIGQQRTQTPIRRMYESQKGEQNNCSKQGKSRYGKQKQEGKISGCVSQSKLVVKYMDYLKQIRNKEIDQIQHILQSN